MKQSLKLCFAQHRIPIMPQAPVQLVQPLKVAYALVRQPVVKPTPHPLETEMSYVLDAEHNRYARHEVETSVFFANRGQSIDVAGRSDPGQIQGNFFNLEQYQDATKIVLDRYKPEPRIRPDDFYDPFDPKLESGPPERIKIQRALDDFLVFIVREKASNKWCLPYQRRKEHETLKMTVERAIAEHHKNELDAYVWSNAPQCVIKAESGKEDDNTFVFVASYLVGRPKFDNIEPAIKEHAWVTRHELQQYSDDFETKDYVSVLRDILPDADFNNSP